MIHSSPEQQGIQVIYSLVFGMGIGLIYEFFRFINAFFRVYLDNNSVLASKAHSFVKKICIFFQITLDLLFSIVYTVLVVIFIFGANDGQIRYFLLLFAVIGFLLYFFTLGKLFVLVENKIALITYKVISTVIKLIKKPFAAINKSIKAANTKKEFFRQFRL